MGAGMVARNIGTVEIQDLVRLIRELCECTVKP